jgi:hypothetical protein
MLKPCVADTKRKIRHPTLNAVDWIVVDIARKDGPISLNPDGLWARISRSMFGLSVPRRLNEDALEALRRFSVRAWYWNFIRTRDLTALVAAGYSHVAALEVMAHVAGERGYCPSIEESAVR